MKPNKKQITACEQIKSQASFWINTNDLLSPTHGSDISEMIKTCEELTEDEARELESKLIDLLIFVRSLDDV